MPYLSESVIRKIITQALKEDIGRQDITTRLVIPRGSRVNAEIITREGGIICGIDIARRVFKIIDRGVGFKALVNDGDRVKPGEVIARINGPAPGILTAERVALNFLGLLSGIATRTQQFVKECRPYQVKILDTRKTIPGLRKLEKYAVKTGGGKNHRHSLDEMILIKDNHLKAGGDTRGLIKRLRQESGPKIKIEIEVKNLKEFKEALSAGPDIVMLDNMQPKEVKKAVKLRKGSREKNARRTLLETSGNISLKNIKAYAATGVDFISLGTLTKDIVSLDLSLKMN